MNRLAVLLPTLILAGCAVGPDFRPPDPPRPADYELSELPAAERVDAHGPTLQPDQDPKADWWRSLGSDALNQTETKALEANNTLAAAKATLRQAMAQVSVAAAAWWPQADFGANVQRNGAGGFTAAGGGTSSNNLSAGPSFNYLLDLFGATARGVEQAEAQADYQRLQLAAAQLSVTGGVATQAIAIASARLQIGNAEQLLADDGKTLELVQRQFAAGKATRADVLTAQSQLAGDRSNIASLRQQLSVARHALAILLSQTPADWAPPEILLGDFHLPDSLPLTLPSRLVHRRPDILAAEAQLHAASAAIGIAEAQFYPSISLSAAVTQQALSVGQLFNSANNLWSVGANLTTPIFHGGALSGQKQAAVEAFQAQLASYEQVVVAAFGQVADELQALDHDAEQVHASESALEIAGRSLTLQRSSYLAGKTSLLQLLTAQRGLAQARQSVAASQAQQLQDVVQFFLALGGGV